MHILSSWLMHALHMKFQQTFVLEIYYDSQAGEFPIIIFDRPIGMYDIIGMYCTTVHYVYCGNTMAPLIVGMI